MKKIIILLILNYLRLFAKLQLRKNPRAVVIGVTGSAGKTSTRLAIVHILKTRGRVKHSSHANSESGISLNILGLNPWDYSVLDWVRLLLMAPLMLIFNWEHYDFYVVEMGIDSPHPPKNMDYLLSIIRPDVGVVLNAGLTHAEAFDHLVKDRDRFRRDQKLRAAVAAEKIKLAQRLSGKNVAVVNLDQKEFVPALSTLTARLITYGESKRANLQVIGDSKLLYQGRVYSYQTRDIFSDSYRLTFAAAVGACAAIGVPPSVSTPLLATYRAPAGRLRIFAGRSGSTIIDSSYNASPDTMLEALKLLKKQGGRHKKIAVLGDMRELGNSTKSAHKQLADWITRYCDEVLLYGESVLAHTYPVLVSRRFPTHHFLSMAELIAYLREAVIPHAWILVKGSQNTLLLERAVEGMLADRTDLKALCRRGRYWDRMRAKLA